MNKFMNKFMNNELYNKLFNNSNTINIKPKKIYKIQNTRSNLLHLENLKEILHTYNDSKSRLDVDTRKHELLTILRDNNYEDIPNIVPIYREIQTKRTMFSIKQKLQQILKIIQDKIYSIKNPNLYKKLPYAPQNGGRKKKPLKKLSKKKPKKSLKKKSPKKYKGPRGGVYIIRKGRKIYQ